MKLMCKCTSDLQPTKILLQVVQVVGLGLHSIEYEDLFSGDSEKFPFEDNLFQSLYYPLQSKFLDTVHTLCGRIPQVFLKQIEKTMKKVYENRVIVYLGANHRY
ncbi:glucoside xylosyltransferase 2 [Limosa lapponica baueri]|uniref:Glucoside xylosyltransferase 2 n=1 Tax=Limosa lapponica baueri TaxID=1758121 RepID=A0A2I0TH09_LIMLA|nr:glucoside xylosyltransferase 2 [Limosa lapponica baueri]